MTENVKSDRSFQSAVETIKSVALEIDPDLSEIAIQLLTIGHEYQFDLAQQPQVSRRIREIVQPSNSDKGQSQ